MFIVDAVRVAMIHPLPFIHVGSFCHVLVIM